MCPSISVSLSPSIYGRVTDYQDRHDTSLSHAAATLIKMGFAWDMQVTEQEKERKRTQSEQAQIKELAIVDLEKAVHEAAQS